MKAEFNFVKLLFPLETTDFLTTYWEKRPLILSRQVPDYYLRLFSQENVDFILASNNPKPPLLRVVKNQEELLPHKYIHPDGSLSLNQLYKAYQENHTIIINGLQQFWQPLAKFCLEIQSVLNYCVIANMYLTPRQSQGLLPHFDTHDVFVLQIEGSKHWKVYEAFESVPLLGSFQPVLSEKQLPRLLEDVTLEAGDLLYIPRGYVHEAMTTERSSLHLTIGIYPAQWLDLIVNALTVLSLKESRLRQALPIGYLDNPDLKIILKEGLIELTELLSKNADLDEALVLLNQRLISQTVPVPDGHFAQMDGLDQIGLETVVEKRVGMRCCILAQGGSVSIQFPGNTIKGPSYIKPALDYIANTSERFSVGMLPNSLSEESKVVLVRRLIRGGLLRVVSVDDGESGEKG